jgi:hypothetical protein
MPKCKLKTLNQIFFVEYIHNPCLSVGKLHHASFQKIKITSCIFLTNKNDYCSKGREYLIYFLQYILDFIFITFLKVSFYFKILTLNYIWNGNTNVRK